MTAVVEGRPAETDVLPPMPEMSGIELADAIYEQSVTYWDRDPNKNRLWQMGVVNTEMTPLEDHPLAALGYELQVKNEGAQTIGAYKVRGATAAVLAAQDRGESFRHVVTASAGNLGLGVAFVAQRAGLDGAIVETASTLSPYKKQRLQKQGAAVHDSHLTLEHAMETAQATGESGDHLFIHPFDSIDTMSGQASVAHEMFEDLFIQQTEGKIDLHKDRLTVFFPGGGIGLGAAGAAVFKKMEAYGLIKNARVVIVQMEGCDQAARMRHGGELLTAETLDTSCDGTAVLEPGKQAMKIAMDPTYVHEIISVPKPLLAKAMRYLTELHGTCVEPAGALSMAGAMYLAERDGPAPQDSRKHVLLTMTSGINISPEAFADFHTNTMPEKPQKIKAAQTQPTENTDVLSPSAESGKSKSPVALQRRRRAARAAGSVATPSTLNPARESEAPPEPEQSATLHGLLEQVATYQESVRRAVAREAHRRANTNPNPLPTAAPKPKSEVVHALNVWRSPTHEHNLYSQGQNHPVSNRFQRQ